MFDEIPQPTKVFKRHQNHDDPGIMAWDHYRKEKQIIFDSVKDNIMHVIASLNTPKEYFDTLTNLY